MEWKRYRLLIVGAVALGLVAAVWALGAEDHTDPAAAGGEDGEEGGPLPSLEEDALESVSIQRPEDEVPTVLGHGEDGWRVTAPVEAAANTPNVSSLVRELTSLTYAGRAAHNPEHHEQLEVDAEHGVHIIVRAGGESVLDMWVGAVQSNNTMVRLEGQDDVLMVSGNIKHAFNRPLRDWRDRTIVEVATGEVREMVFRNEHGVFHLRKAPEPTEAPAEEPAETPETPEGEEPAAPASPTLVWQQVLEAPEGETPPAAIEGFDPARVSTLVNTLGNLSAQDFAGSDVTPESAGLGASAATAVITSGEGDAATTLTLRIGNEVEAGQRYVQKNDEPTIYVVSSHVAGRLMPDAAAFQPPPPGETPPEGAPPPPGGGGNPSLSDEQMQQIMRQLQQQGMH